MLACGDKFLVSSRGTRFQRAAVARKPASILIYTNPASELPKVLANIPVDATLTKAGYRPTTVATSDEFDKALSRGGWDLVLVGMADAPAVSKRLRGDLVPAVLPVVFNPTTSELKETRKRTRSCSRRRPRASRSSPRSTRHSLTGPSHRRNPPAGFDGNDQHEPSAPKAAFDGCAHLPGRRRLVCDGERRHRPGLGSASRRGCGQLHLSEAQQHRAPPDQWLPGGTWAEHQHGALPRRRVRLYRSVVGFGRPALRVREIHGDDSARASHPLSARGRVPLLELGLAGLRLYRPLQRGRRSLCVDTVLVGRACRAEATTTRGEAVVGRNLREVRIAVDAGQRLDAISPKLSVQGRYSYAFVERVHRHPEQPQQCQRGSRVSADEEARDARAGVLAAHARRTALRIATAGEPSLPWRSQHAGAPGRARSSDAGQLLARRRRRLLLVLAAGRVRVLHRVCRRHGHPCRWRLQGRHQLAVRTGQRSRYSLVRNPRPGRDRSIGGDSCRQTTCRRAWRGCDTRRTSRPETMATARGRHWSGRWRHPAGGR